jgi:hypothetical protein
MKRFLFTIKAACLCVLVLVFTKVSQAQETKDKNNNETAIRSLLDSKNFVFKAQSVSPTGGSIRQLTSEYDVRVSGDTVRTFLPYFGRAYSAPIGATSGGINFTSTDVDYQFKEGKKGRVEILIRPKDAQDVRQMLLSVSKSGYASLQVLSNNRQPISFNGIVTERRGR